MELENYLPLELGGKEYPVVKVGTQLWMAENLALLTPGSWFYEDNEMYGEKFGRLYTWQAAMEACPKGWKLPSQDDWSLLLEALGGEEAAWSKMMPGGASGLNILFAGYRNIKGVFMSVDRAADFWTSTEAGDANAWLRYLIHKKEKVHHIIDDKNCGFSVRYIKKD